MTQSSLVPRRRPWSHPAALQHGEAATRQTLPKATGSCPSPCRVERGEHGQLCATHTWQHVIKAGAGFRVAQQRLWSEDYQLEWGIRGRARWSETPLCKPVLEQPRACPPLPILPEQGSSCQADLLLTQLQCSARLGTHSRQHQPVRMSPGEEEAGLPGTCLSHGWT